MSSADETRTLTCVHRRRCEQCLSGEAIAHDAYKVETLVGNITLAYEQPIVSLTANHRLIFNAQC